MGIIEVLSSYSLITCTTLRHRKRLEIAYYLMQQKLKMLLMLLYLIILIM